MASRCSSDLMLVMLAALALAATMGVVEGNGGGATPSNALQMGQGDFGSLVLCPPGGKSFRMAWSLACEVRKRRKRSAALDSAGDDDDNEVNFVLDGSDNSQRNFQNLISI